MERLQKFQFMGISKAFQSLIFLALLSACMPKIQNEDPLSSPEILSNEIVRYNGSQAKIMIYGYCPTNTKELKITVDEDSYSTAVSSNLSITDGSGTPAGNCAGNAMTIVYPVPNPSTSRTIAFKVKALTVDGRLSVYWAKVNVNYTLPTNNSMGGFAVTSGGRDVTDGSSRRAQGTVGEPYGPYQFTSGSVQMRSTLNGLLFDDGI